MIEVQAMAGTPINQAAEQLVEAVKASGDAFLIFNDICLTANQFSTVKSICNDYDRLSELRRKEYQASPEGKAFKAKQDAETYRLQVRADLLMESLPHLQYSNVGNLLWWLCEIEASRDRIGVTVDETAIAEIFKRHGYTPHMKCSPEFDETDREIYAQWIIGQSLGNARCGRTRWMTEQWKERFAK